MGGWNRAVIYAPSTRGWWGEERENNPFDQKSNCVNPAQLGRYVVMRKNKKG